jgi:hypothetical protein
MSNTPQGRATEGNAADDALMVIRDGFRLNSWSICVIGDVKKWIQEKTS